MRPRSEGWAKSSLFCREIVLFCPQAKIRQQRLDPMGELPSSARWWAGYVRDKEGGVALMQLLDEGREDVSGCWHR